MPAKFTAAEVKNIEAGIVSAGAALRPAPRTPVNGWIYPNPAIGDYRQDYTLRARVALHGLGALPRQEAMYMQAATPEGRTNFAEGLWRLNFPSGQLPP